MKALWRYETRTWNDTGWNRWLPSRWFQKIPGDSRRFQEIFRDSRRFSEIPGDPRRFQEIPGDPRQFQEISGGPRNLGRTVEGPRNRLENWDSPARNSFPEQAGGSRPAAAYTEHRTQNTENSRLLQNTEHCGFAHNTEHCTQGFSEQCTLYKHFLRNLYSKL